MNSNLAILLLSSNTYPSIRNSKIQKKVFFNQSEKLEHIYWYKQGPANKLNNLNYILDGKDLLINEDDSSIGMGRKTIKAFEWLIENTNFEYVFRTNTSSYVSIKNLIAHINNDYINYEYVYSGLIHQTNDKSGNKISFASGSGYLLNRRVVENIIENQHNWLHEYWDDVSLAILLKDLGIYPTNAKRFDIEGNIFKQKIDMNQYHFRCRIDNHYKYPRFLEYYVISYLNKLELETKFSNLNLKIMSVIFEISRVFYIQQFTWKVFLVVRFLLKKLLPKQLYIWLKKIFSKSLLSFKLKRFKT